jgi:hypothetical protein
MGAASCTPAPKTYPHDCPSFFRRVPVAVGQCRRTRRNSYGGVRFDRDIRPILSDKCYHCHGPDEAHREAELRLDLEAPAKEIAIVPGNADDSELVRRILSHDPDEMMPPPSIKKPLDPVEIELLRRWVEQGAEWTLHWAFVPLARPPLPAVTSPERGINAIDHFVMVQLTRGGMQPNPEADRQTLIRRVTFDLTGLPPTLQEGEAFVADRSDDAYEKVVDRLLDSSPYGERMALMWLDARLTGVEGARVVNELLL